LLNANQDKSWAATLLYERLRPDKSVRYYFTLGQWNRVLQARFAAWRAGA